jgi:hypothetical protein
MRPIFFCDISAISLSQKCHEINASVKRDLLSAGIKLAAKVSDRRTIRTKASAEALHLK